MAVVSKVFPSPLAPNWRTSKIPGPAAAGQSEMPSERTNSMADVFTKCRFLMLEWFGQILPIGFYGPS
jgi:hypothetical protein